jgi:hypothetical protein
VQVKKGLLLKENNTIDYEKSSPQVYIIDENGQTQVVSPSELSDVVEKTWCRIWKRQLFTVGE